MQTNNLDQLAEETLEEIYSHAQKAKGLEALEKALQKAYAMGREDGFYDGFYDGRPSTILD